MNRPLGLARVPGVGGVLEAVTRMGLLKVAIASLVMVLLGSGAARAGDATEFWPEFNAFVPLNPQARLYFVTAYTRGMDSYSRALDLAGYLDVSLKPPFRRTLRQQDWLRNKYLWARVGYVHVLKGEDGTRSPSEDRAVVSVHGRVYPPGEILCEGRVRAEFRWIGGEYSERYRLRGEVNREFRLFDHAVTPYAQAEWFYDSRYDGWARILVQPGAEITFSKLFRAEFYVARQQDELPRESAVNAFGVVARFFF